MVIEERNIGICVLLTFITFGVYGLYWVYKMTEEMREMSGDESLNGVLAVLLPLVTCNLYGLYWNYKVGKDVPAAKAKVGQTGEDKSVIFILLSFFGLSLISYILLQVELNDIAKTQSNVKPL